MTMASVAETQPGAARPETEVSEHESLQLTKNLLRIAMSNISYSRGFFPESFYCEKFVPALEMKVNKLLPMDMESQRFIDWIEKGVFDALQKKYLRTLLLTISRGEDGPPIEEYSFSFKYAAEGASEITSMVIGSSRGKRVQADTTNQTSRLQMKQSACKMVRTLVQLMYTLDDVPQERVIAMRLHYYDDVTPEKYEPPLFVSGTDDDPNPWDNEPLKMTVGHVDSMHHKLAIKVKSVLDPCDDEDDLVENGTSIEDLMLKGDDDSSSSDGDSSTSSEAMVVNTQSSQPWSQPSQSCQPIQRIITPRKASKNKDEVQLLITDKKEHTVLDAERLPKDKRSSQFQKGEDMNAHMPDNTTGSPPLLMIEPGPGVLQTQEGSIEPGLEVLQIQEGSIEPGLQVLQIQEGSIEPGLQVLQIQEGSIEPGLEVLQIQEGSRSNGKKRNRKLNSKSPRTNAKSNNMTSKADNVPDDRVAFDRLHRLYEMALLYTLPRKYITTKQLQKALGDATPLEVRTLRSQMSRDGYIKDAKGRKGTPVIQNLAAKKKLQELRSKQKTEGAKVLPPQQELPTDSMQIIAIPTLQQPPVPRKTMKKRAKVAAPSNSTPPMKESKRKRVTFEAWISPEDVDEDCVFHGHFKARKVNGDSSQSRARVKKPPSLAGKGKQFALTGEEPYQFDAEVAAEKSSERNFQENTMIDHLDNSPSTDSYDVFSSSSESIERVVNLLTSGEKTWRSFKQRETVLAKCPRPLVYVRRARAG